MGTHGTSNTGADNVTSSSTSNGMEGRVVRQDDRDPGQDTGERDGDDAGPGLPEVQRIGQGEADDVEDHEDRVGALAVCLLLIERVGSIGDEKRLDGQQGLPRALEDRGSR